MAYTTQPLVSAFIKRSLTANEITLFNIMLTTVTNWINNQIDSAFGTTVETTKYYDGGTRYLDIDPCIELTAVNLVDSEETSRYLYILNEDYEQQPLNETVKTMIEYRLGIFPSGLGNIAVTAKFTRGEAVPDDIQYLATYLMGKLYSQAVTGDLKRESIEGYSREFKTFTMQDEAADLVLTKYGNDEVML